MSRPQTIAHLRPKSDNVPAHRLDTDPRRALVRPLAELLVEAYLIQQAQPTENKQKQ